MSVLAKSLPERRPQLEEKWLVQLTNWVRSLVGRKPRELVAFTDRLVTAFQLGIEVTLTESGPRFATLDAIDPGDNQVAALVRLSRNRPKENRSEIRRGMVDLEERDRELFTDSSSAASVEEGDLLLTYSFPLLISVEQNLDLFGEFARNQLIRLRANDFPAPAVNKEP